MNIKDLISFDEFSRINYVVYGYVYMDYQLEHSVYHPRRMGVEILEMLYNKFAGFNCTFSFKNDEEGTTLYIYHIIKGSTPKDKLRENYIYMPTLEEINNSKWPVVAKNLYSADGNQLITALLTDSYRSITYFPFKDDVHTVVDIRDVTESQWNDIIVPKIVEIQYEDDRMVIKFKESIIRLMEGI